MSKSKIIFAFAGFVIAAAVGLPARANHDHENDNHSNECQGNWDRVHVSDAECEHSARQIDKDGNHDNVVCEKRNYGVVKYRDNKKHGHDHHD